MCNGATKRVTSKQNSIKWTILWTKFVNNLYDLRFHDLGRSKKALMKTVFLNLSISAALAIHGLSCHLTVFEVGPLLRLWAQSLFPTVPRMPITKIRSPFYSIMRMIEGFVPSFPFSFFNLKTLFASPPRSR